MLTRATNRIVMAAALLIVSSLSLVAQRTYMPTTGYVPDADTAVKNRDRSVGADLRSKADSESEAIPGCIARWSLDGSWLSPAEHSRRSRRS